MKNLQRNRFLLRQKYLVYCYRSLKWSRRKNKTGKVKNVSNYIYAQRRIKLQDSQLNEIPQYLVRPCVKSPTVARAARDFRYQDNTGTLLPVSLERANNHDRNSWLFSLTALINITFFFLIVFSHSINKHNLSFFFFYKASFILFNW